MAAIRLKNVHKTYPNNVLAVSSFNLDINEGEFLILVGPSGCGKSTILRLIAGLEELTDGMIYIGDQLVNDVVPKDRNIAMVFQNYALYPHMSVYQNMAFGLEMRKVPKTDIGDRVLEAADMLQIRDLLDRKPKELSGGQQQRVALGRAIVQKPAVFLFDEPLSNLDAKLRVQMRAQIKTLHALLKTTIVYVTHDQVEAMTMGDRIVIMHEGLIQQTGTPLEIYHQPHNRFVGEFIGSPPMNILPVTISKDPKPELRHPDFVLPLSGTSAWLDSIESRQVNLGIRPEDVTLADPHSADIHATWPVVLIESMGHESLVYFKLADGNFVAKVNDVPGSLKEGADIGVRFQLDRLHLFHRESGEVLTP